MPRLTCPADAIDASLRMEEFTAQKEARIRQLGAEILTVDPNYRATPSGAEDAGQIVSTVRNADAAAQLLGLQPEQLLKDLQSAAAKPAQERGTRRACVGTCLSDSVTLGFVLHAC